MIIRASRVLLLLLISTSLLLPSCVPAKTPVVTLPTQTSAVATITPTATATGTPTPLLTATTDITSTPSSVFISADGSRLLTFPQDFGAHPDFRTEWWYYTGNLDTQDGQHFGFELTIFRVGLVPPAAEIPASSKWSSREVYFAHFAISDIANEKFYAFQRYSRPGPGLAGAEANPYHVWLEDWTITGNTDGTYHLQAEQKGISIDLTLTDEMGVVLHGENGYSRKGEDPTNASYYYSQPRLRANGFIGIQGAQIPVSGLVWNDHEFSTGVLDENQIGWDWFSLQFEEGGALMLFQLREREGGISESASGTFISADGTRGSLVKSDFAISVLDEWRSPHTQGVYPAGWNVKITKPDCQLNIQPWMTDQEINFPPITYWEGAVRFEGICNNAPVRGNGYIELTGYAGSLPLP